MKKITLILLKLFIVSSIYAQCTAPNFNVNFTAAADTSWTLTSTTRSGVCCGSSNCVTFNVTLHPNTELISFDVTSPSPSGSAFYQINCGPPVSIGTPFCAVGLASPFTITYCKPGGDSPNYILSAGTIVHASDDISIRETSCVDTLFVTNVQTSSILWTSIYPGAQGAYNSYLSCTSACNSTIVTPGVNPPPYIDFQVSGNPNTNCGSFSRDTVRVYFVSPLTGTVSPSNPVICGGSGTSVTLTALPAGGALPYTYDWGPGPNVSTYTASSAGTYTVTIGDNTNCPDITLTKVIASSPSATFSYSEGSFCKNSPNVTPVFTGVGQAGVFSSSPTGLVFVNTSTGEINFAASSSGTYTITNTIAPTGSCPGTSSTFTLTIYPYAVMTSASALAICSGNTVNINLTSSVSATYSWIAADNSNIDGESLSEQNSSSVINTLTNNTGTSQIVSYTVTPISTAIDACTGQPQTVNVTVNPMDDAGFTYSSSTNCQTGADPTTTITGLPGGTFGSTGGLVFTSTSTGTIDLSASALGSYTVTYSTNGICPNTETFPITVTTAPSAIFTYPGTPYCQDETNPTPVFGPGAGGGTFTSTAGLVFVNAATGEVDLGSSLPGTYTVTNTIPAAGGCSPAVATATIRITPVNIATFSYPGTPYCKNGTNPLPVYSNGGVAGTFTSTAGLSINTLTGEIYLSSSTAGTYTVTNTIAANSGCPSVSATATITITDMPVSTFSYTATPYCQNGADPAPVFAGGGAAGVFTASSVYIEINPSNGTVDLSNSPSGNYFVTNTIAAVNGCPAASTTTPLTITSLPVAVFSYIESPYCQNGTDPTPELVADGTNGIYSASPSGLVIDANAGTVDLSASAPGSYTINNTVAAADGCPQVLETATLTITPLPVATFSYTGTPYCQNAGSASPTFTGGAYAGTFSSTAGLSINFSTGVVDLASSTSGTYTVTNTIDAANGCPAVTATATITITTLPVATFIYTDSPYCQNLSNPLPTFTGGGVAGTFSSTSGLNINSVAGTIDPEASTAGTYMVTNMIDAANGCPSVTASTSITITPLPIGIFNYSDMEFCQNGSDPLPTLTLGAIAGTFTSTSGLNINDSTGFINLLSSTIGTYDVINTIDAANGCPAVTETVSLTINPVASADAGADAAICEGNSYILSGTIGGGASSLMWTSNGTGSFDDNTSATAKYTPSVSDIIAGNIILTLTTNDPAGPCSATSDAMTLTIEPAAIANASSDAVMCSGTSFTLSGTIGGGASSLTWTTSGSGIFNDSSLSAAKYDPSLNDIAAGAVTLTLTTNDPAGVCPAVTDEMVITISPAAIANAGSDSSICEGSTFSLSGMIGGGASSLTWSTNGSGTFNDMNSASAVYTPSANDITNGSVILTLTTNDPAGPCDATSDAMILIIEPAAIANAASDALICSGTVYTLSGNINGGASSLSWTSTGSGNFDNNASANAIYTPSTADIASGNITLTMTTNDPAGFCAAVADDMILTINPDPTAYAGPDTSVCSGNSYALTGAVGGGASSLTWTSNGSGTFDNNTSASAIYYPSSADISAGSVILTITTNDPAGPCDAASDAMTLIINTIPVVNAGQDMSICSGNQNALSGSVGGGASSLIWTTSGSGNFDDASSANAVYSPSASDIAAGSVILTLTTNDPSGPCGSVSDAMQLMIDPAAVVNAGSDATICEGTSHNLAGGISGGASSMMWTSSGSGSFGNASSGNTVYTPSSADIANGSVVLTITTNDPSGPCGSISDQMVLNILPRDNASISYNGSLFCQSGTNPSPVVNGIQGGGFSSTSGLMIDPSNGVINLSASALGTYTVTYTTGGSCPQSSSVIITITDAQSAQFSYSAPSYCNNAGDPLPMLGAGSTAGVFSAGSGLVIDPNTGVVDLSASTPGTYTVTNSVAASGGCAATSSAYTITINPLDDPSFSYAASAFCHSSENQLPTVTGTSGGMFSCSTSGIVLNAAGEICVSASVPGTYPVTYTTNGICYNSATMNVTINSLPLVDAGDERLIDCGANPINIEVVDSMGNVINYSWNTNGGNILSGDGTNEASINQTGLYYVTATNTFGCTACDTVIVTESPVIPEASFTASPTELTGIVPFEVNFDNTSVNANTYSWNFGDQSGGTSVTSPDYTFNSVGTYTVTLIASNNGRCADTTDVIIKVEDEFMIPEAFSPNGDGINDVFVIRGIDRFKGNKFVVFNRWGNQVHEAAPYTNQWDGRTNQDIQLGGNELPVGTYFYVLDLGDGSKPYKGYIYLNK